MTPRSKTSQPVSGNPGTAGLARPKAVIEVGSTAVRMLVADIEPSGEYRVLESLQQAVPLGADAFSDGTIRPERVEECVKVLGDFRRILNEYGLKDAAGVTAVATSAIREASNRQAVLDRIYIATGINLLCIDTAEVNRYTYLAVTPYLGGDASLRRGVLMVVEVGGGSTEILLFRNGNVASAHTYRLGSFRIRKTIEEYKASQKRAAELMREHADRAIDTIVEGMGRCKPHTMLLLGGDARLAADELAGEWDRKKPVRVAAETFGRFAKQACETSVDDLVRQHHIPYADAEVFGPGLLICARFAHMLDVKTIAVGAASLRDGIVRELASAGDWTAGFRRQTVQSAVALGRKYRFDEKHAVHVSKLALMLFEKLRDEHGLDRRAEMILHVAGILHDIGCFVSASAHHKHSMYLIANSDVFGLGSPEIRIASQVARYHRQSLPKDSHPDYAVLGREDRILVSKLAAILRVADALDRGHVQRCRDVEVELQPGRMILTARNAGNLVMEQHGMREKAQMFERVYGRKVVLRAVFQ